jgi:hypothetical protein
MRFFLSVLLVIVAAGCATPEERAARMQREVDEMITVYGPACEKLGYVNGSDPWRDCVLRLNANETIARYSTRPTTTTCFGHRGFFNCSTF